MDWVSIKYFEQSEMRNSEYKHTPVLWQEIKNSVQESPFAGSGIFVDCTLGEGGHSELLLRTFPQIKIIAFERDEQILEVAKNRLEEYNERITFVNDNFAAMQDYVKEDYVQYILYDFGISSYHYESDRGFAFAVDGELDMRLDPGCTTDAYTVINTYKEQELADIIYTYGEERWSRRIAARICEYRQQKKIETTTELAELVLKAIPGKFHVKNIHPATRVFQALRIYVNDELTAISQALSGSYRQLQAGGRIMAISFHSLEDRIVKDRFRRMAKGCTCKAEPQHCICTGAPVVKLITKKPVTPGEQERNDNSRARSSKLRICERI